MESLFLSPDYSRVDLAQMLRAVQAQEKQKLHLVCLLYSLAIVLRNFCPIKKNKSSNFYDHIKNLTNQ
jgi:hypothetical protein